MCKCNVCNEVWDEQFIIKPYRIDYIGNIATKSTVNVCEDCWTSREYDEEKDEVYIYVDDKKYWEA